LPARFDEHGRPIGQDSVADAVEALLGQGLGGLFGGHEDRGSGDRREGGGRRRSSGVRERRDRRDRDRDRDRREWGY